MFYRFLRILDSVAESMKNRRAIGKILSNLNDQAFCVTKFHNELKKGMDSAAEIYLKDHDNNESWQNDWETKKNIGDVFIAMKTKFLVYAPFIVMCNNVEKMISVLQCDPNVKHEAEDLEKELMKEMSISGDGRRPTTFNALLSLPFQHLLR